MKLRRVSSGHDGVFDEESKSLSRRIFETFEFKSVNHSVAIAQFGSKDSRFVIFHQRQCHCDKLLLPIKPGFDRRGDTTLADIVCVARNPGLSSHDHDRQLDFVSRVCAQVGKVKLRLIGHEGRRAGEIPVMVHVTRRTYDLKANRGFARSAQR